MAFDCFLKIDAIPGESTDNKHVDWIELISYSHTLAQPTSGSVSSGGGRTAERVDHGDFVITKLLDKSSPKLTLACCNGTHIPNVKIELCRSAGDKEKYMEYLLNDVIVKSVSPEGMKSGDSPLPSEKVSFSYGKISWTYTELDHKTGKSKGNVQTYWDLHTNKGG